MPRQMPQYPRGSHHRQRNPAFPIVVPTQPPPPPRRSRAEPAPYSDTGREPRQTQPPTPRTPTVGATRESPAARQGSPRRSRHPCRHSIVSPAKAGAQYPRPPATTPSRTLPQPPTLPVCSTNPRPRQPLLPVVPAQAGTHVRLLPAPIARTVVPSRHRKSTPYLKESFPATDLPGESNFFRAGTTPFRVSGGAANRRERKRRN